MIRINLLPAGLRKRQSSEFNPESLLIVAGLLLILAAGGFWGWVKYSRIPNAQAIHKDRVAELAVVTAQANEVRAMKKQIASFEAKVQELKSLIGEKAYWAEAINDFADTFGRDKWQVDGRAVSLKVSCRKFTLKPGRAAGGRRGSKSKKTGIPWDIGLEFQLVGEDFDQTGVYLKAFFQTLAASSFWTKWDIQPHPETFFVGDSWRQVEGGAVEFIQPMRQVVRTHQIHVPGVDKAKAAPGKSEG